ncbi:MAG: serine hydrolase [Novosphingobium sp.]
MLFLDGRDDMAAYAEAQPLEAEPGRKWEYSSATTVILADLAARALTSSTDPAERRRVVGDYLRTRIFDPLGMKSMVPEFDTAGTLIGGSLIHGTARDWGRFGEFLRNKGAVKGIQLVPTAWIAFMTRPQSAQSRLWRANLAQSAPGRRWPDRMAGFARQRLFDERPPGTIRTGGPRSRGHDRPSRQDPGRRRTPCSGTHRNRPDCAAFPKEPAT